MLTEFFCIKRHNQTNPITNISWLLRILASIASYTIIISIYELMLTDPESRTGTNLELAITGLLSIMPLCFAAPLSLTRTHTPNVLKTSFLSAYIFSVLLYIFTPDSLRHLVQPFCAAISWLMLLTPLLAAHHLGQYIEKRLQKDIQAPKQVHQRSQHAHNSKTNILAVKTWLLSKQLTLQPFHEEPTWQD